MVDVVEEVEVRVGVGTITRGNERRALRTRPKSLKPNVQSGKQSAKD
jgi:hypothetical protein